MLAILRSHRQQRFPLTGLSKRAVLLAVMLLALHFASASLATPIIMGAKINLYSLILCEKYESPGVAKRVRRQFIQGAWDSVLPGSQIHFIEGIKGNAHLSKLLIRSFKERSFYCSFKFNATHNIFFALDGTVEIEQIIIYGVMYPRHVIDVYNNGKWFKIPFWRVRKEVMTQFMNDQDIIELFFNAAAQKAALLAPSFKAMLRRK